MAGYLVPGIGWVEDGQTGNNVLYPGGAFQESEAVGSSFQSAWARSTNKLIGRIQMSFLKNTAVTGFAVGLVSSTDGSDITSGTPVGYYTLDGGTQAAIADVTPVHEGNGLWSFDLTAAEMNGDIVGLTFTHTSAITVHFTIKTETKLVSALNDIAATDIVSAGAITTLTGAVVNVDTVDTTITNTDMRGTDSAALASVCTETRLSELDPATAGKMANQVDIIQTDTTTDIPATITTLQSDTGDIQVQIGAAGAGLTDLGGMSVTMKAEINAEVVDVITADIIAEVAQGIPTATPTLDEAIMYIYMALRNKVDVTATVKEFHNDAGTVVWKKSLSDDGTTYSEAEGISGP